MAKPINPTPTLRGEAAIEFLKEMERMERGEFTPEELAYRERILSLDRIIPFGE